MTIDPKDLNAINHLFELEQSGETGFAAYYNGDVEGGTKQIKNILKESKSTLRTIHDPKLREEANNLFKEMNQALNEYIKEPSKESFKALEHRVDNYKGFLDDKKG